MEQELKLSLLFEEPPTKYGLRGDEPLWQEFAKISNNIDLPSDAEQLLLLLYRLFFFLVGEELKPDKFIYLQRLNKGGMSAGKVSTDFWIENAFPLLIERYTKLVK